MLPPARWKRGRATRCEPAGRPRGAPASTVRAPGCLRWQVIAADEYVARVDRLREVDDGVVALVVSGAGARRSRGAPRLRDLKNRDRCTLTCTVSDDLG